MLLGILIVLSVVSVVALGVATDVLWLIPVYGIGSFLVWAALAFGLLLLVCACIDPDKPREKDNPLFRKMVMTYIHAVLTILPVKIRAKGLEKIPQDGRFLLVCNHLDNVDPAFLYYCFPKSQLAFVAKKETKNMFLVKKVLPVLLCQQINRENDREALKTIVKCIGLLKEDKVSVAIFPEGRINKFCKLAHFRPGVFKMAQKAQVPIVVCTLLGTNHVIRNLLKCKGSVVDVHLLDVITPEQFEGKTTVDVAEQVYAMMAADLGEENVLTPEEEENA